MTRRAIVAAMVCALPVPAAAAAQERVPFEPHPWCAPAYALGAAVDSTALRAGRGTLVVRLRGFDGERVRSQFRIGFVPVDSVNPAAGGPAWSPDTGTVLVYGDRPAGRYGFVARGIGYYPAHDTLVVRAGRTDTVDVSLQTWHEGYRNQHSCRPRGFRRPGERACVTDRARTDEWLSYARDLAGGEQREMRDASGLTPFRASAVALVRDERLCRRAGVAYWGQNGEQRPPRRVIVVRLGAAGYLIFDPFEPMAAGEWDVLMITDAELRPIKYWAQ